MSDIRPAGGKTALSASQTASRAFSEVKVNQPTPPSLPISDHQLPVPEQPPQPTKKKRSKLKLFLVSLVVVVILMVCAVGAALFWYQQQLLPVSQDGGNRVRIVIAPGSTPNAIAKELQSQGVIRSEMAFLIYTQLTKVRDDLKAGAYNLKPSESLPEIVKHLVSGKQDEFSITFLPGDTLSNHRKRIIAAGYSAAEVDAALAKQYDHPALATKPVSVDLEGYIYGETYNFLSGATVEEILTRTFDELEKQIVKYDLVAAYKKQNLSLYQGITLASIIQREVPGQTDQKQVAQVFFSRMKVGMTLGSDVTYQYAADKMGVPRDPGLDSPYNTRRYTGLPPGPIASPGLGSLLATAAPASGDYLFFLSGDDDKTYFGRTDAEHQQNIVNHCQKKCAIL